MHRKVWEFCYIAQALSERDMLREGRRGVGFAVGQEPLPSLFAGLGCQIMATDLQTEEALSKGWVTSNQHADDVQALNKRGLCPDSEFLERVSFRFVDMRQIPQDLRGFDFIWSSCSLEHLGTIELGERFIFEAMECLKPGGIAVHTTEYNLSSNRDTLTEGPTVLFRRQDLERIGRKLRAEGHKIDLDFRVGTGKADKVVDRPPYTHQISLRIEVDRFVITSYGLIIQKSLAP